MAANTSTSTTTTTGSFNLKHWLKAIGASRYTAAFTGHGIVSYERCINLSEDDLQAVGVNDVRFMMDRVKELRKLSEEDAMKLLSVSTRNKYTVSLFWSTFQFYAHYDSYFCEPLSVLILVLVKLDFSVKTVRDSEYIDRTKE